ncbi:MAG: hypothetical protein HC930_02710 [Hydrococcus sp. SU_1_0]|nr:hypothetical protein [Hydrococcus sp. SU_1_0]
MQSSTNHPLRTKFTVESEWDKGFTGRLELTNTGANLADWTIEFVCGLELNPKEIWGAEIVSHTGDRYTLNPVDYNQSLDAQESTSIVFNANKIQGKILEPQEIRLGEIQSDVIEVMPVKDSTTENTVTEDIPPAISGNTDNTETTTDATNDLPVDVNFSLVKDWGDGFRVKYLLPTLAIAILIAGI